MKDINNNKLAELDFHFSLLWYSFFFFGGGGGVGYFDYYNKWGGELNYGSPNKEDHTTN